MCLNNLCEIVDGKLILVYCKGEIGSIQQRRIIMRYAAVLFIAGLLLLAACGASKDERWLLAENRLLNDALSKQAELYFQQSGSEAEDCYKQFVRICEKLGSIFPGCAANEPGNMQLIRNAYYRDASRQLDALRDPKLSFQAAQVVYKKFFYAQRRSGYDLRQYGIVKPLGVEELLFRHASARDLFPRVENQQGFDTSWGLGDLKLHSHL